MKTVMITGANSGLGFETARKIAEDKEYAVILACRNNAKAQNAQKDIVDKTGNQNISIQILDTSSMESVRKCADRIQEEGILLDALICNAGISPQHSGITADGFELVFETNYLGHYLLVMELLSRMKPDARILNVTSDMHNPPGGIIWRGADYLAYHAQNDRQRYSYSKLCNILFTYRLAKELKQNDRAITANCFNPGFMAETNFSGGHHGRIHAGMVKAVMPKRYGTLEGSSTELALLATADKYAYFNGQYFDRTCGIGKSSELSHDAAVQEELWKKSQEYTGIDADEILKQI